MLHGAIGAQDQLENLAQQLSDRYEVLRFDFSGHGGKPYADKPFSIALFAEEVKQFFEENKLSNIPIFGYSMGGYVAFYLSKHYPGSVSKIITLATKFHWNEAIAEKEVKMLNPEKIEEKLPAFAMTLQERHAPNDWKDVLKGTREMMHDMGKQNPLQIEDYSSIDIPCLVLIGDRDKMITLEETLAVYKQLPSAQMGMLPNTHHPIEQVNVEMLNWFIKEFV